MKNITFVIPINVNNLEPQPIIDKTKGRYRKTGKVVSLYLKLLTKNEFVITNI